VRPDGREYSVPAAGLLIGRRADAGVPLDDPEVSRRHAEVRCRGGQYLVADLGSSNGTLLNGQPVNAETPLADGDVLQVGGARLTFRLRRRPVAPPPPAVPAPPARPAPVAPPRAAAAGAPGMAEATLQGRARLTVECADLPAGPGGPAAVLRLGGVLDVETVGLFKEQTEPLLRRGVMHFTVELSGLDYLDSSGLAALVALRRQVGGGTVSLQQPRPAVRGIIELTRLDRLFTMQ